jgi:hypothetical protein
MVTGDVSLKDISVLIGTGVYAMEDDQEPTAVAELRIMLEPVAAPLLQAGATAVIVLDITVPPAGAGRVMR